MTLYFLVKYLHVLGAIVILGTGTGIAFFMLMAHRSGDAAFIARTAATVVIADMLFTLTAVLLQPVTGGVLMMLSSTAFAERWLSTSLALYAVAGLFWVPVIFMQIEMRDLARAAAAEGAAAAAALFRAVSPLVPVRHSRLRFGHGHPVADDRKAGSRESHERDAQNPGARRLRPDRAVRHRRFARAGLSGDRRRAAFRAVAKDQRASISKCRSCRWTRAALARLFRDREIDVVVNCLGVLQDGPGSDTGAVHRDFVERLLPRSATAAARSGSSTSRFPAPPTRTAPPSARPNARPSG